MSQGTEDQRRPEPPGPGDFEGVRRALGWALEQPGVAWGLVSAFGPGSAVLFEALAELGAGLPVHFVDTLHHFPETLAHAERVRERYRLDLHVHRAEPDREAFEAKHGPRLWARDLELYQRVTKVEPFRAACRAVDGLLTGRRRDQAASRAGLPLLEVGSPLRLNPLATWRRADVWGFIRERGLPYNTLHDRGYASIGDEPLTTPVSDGEDERAGRWRGLDRLECGIHQVTAEPKARLA